ncbi:MAG: Smr/MutS family protein [Mollicutes bacterium]|jgi:DNA-nicking Smr family endonuclease|nr:Smr/MutS family protein [Mollicutes bacterium]
MRNLNDIIFIDNLPKLDLHGLDRASAAVAINDFIKDNIKLKNDIVLIIHGIGQGILKQVTHECLKNNRNVLDYKTYYYNNGCTIVKLMVDKNLQ